MKIGIYDPYLDDVGGGEKYMLTIAEVLSKEHDVFVFWDNKEDLQKVQERFSLDLSRVKISPNIFSPSVSFTKRLLASRKFDAIIILSDGSIPLLLSKQLFIHIQQPLKEFQGKSIKNRFKIRRVNAFFCNSEYTRQFIDDKFHIKTIVIYPPVKVAAKKIKKQNIILHVGRFRVMDKAVGVADFKKQHVMIKAFKELVDKGLKSWKFVMCVSVQDEDKQAFEKMKKEASKYPIEFQVNKTNEQLWEYYSEAKIYWHASGYGEDLDKHPEYAEHFGISTVEAMGAGVVPVVINSGGQKIIVTDAVNGLLWSTIPELEEETLLLTKSKDLLSDLSKQARVRALDFSEDMFAEKIRKMVGCL